MKHRAGPIYPRPKYYGWRPSLPDPRDRRFALDVAAIKPSVDLRPQCPPAMKQLSLGSCVAHAVTAAMRHDVIAAGKPDVPLSRLQLYYDGRRIENTITEDAGLEVRDAIKCAVKLGVAPESAWPYSIRRFAIKPPSSVYKKALGNQALLYQSVDVSMNGVKSALSAGFVVIIGVSVFDSFESDAAEKTGEFTVPSNTESMLGGHCMYLYGYDSPDSAFANGRNSWGEEWGDKGDFHIPWAYVGNRQLAADFWCIKATETSV